MRLNDEDIRKFIAIYQEEFGETLSFAEASEVAFRLVNLYAQLTKVLPSEEKSGEIRIFYDSHICPRRQI